MIAYFIMVHQYPNQFKKLFKAIYHSENHYLIHIDKKSDNQLHVEIQDFLAGFPNVSLLKSMTTNWGGYSLVDAELKGIKTLLQLNKDWKFFINLSGQDFPLKTQAYIFDYLNRNQGKDFLKLSNQKNIRPETLNRIENYVVETDSEIHSVAPTLKRSFLRGVTPYIGNQWMILSRRFCEFVAYNKEVERFKSFYKNTFIADEGFFQTVIMNTSYKNNVIVNDDKRAIDWIQLPDEIKLRPRNFTAADASSLLNSQHLFARKFDETVDKEIMQILGQSLLATPLEKEAKQNQ